MDENTQENVELVEEQLNEAGDAETAVVDAAEDKNWVANELAAQKAAKAQAKAQAAAEKAEKKAAREAAKAEKAQISDAKKAEKAAKAAAKALEKETSARPSNNGVTRPKPESKCGQAWAFMDSLSEARGAPVAIADLLKVTTEAGLNPGNVKAEYNVWRRFHGVEGRVHSETALQKKAEAEAAKAAKDAAKVAEETAPEAA